MVTELCGADRLIEVEEKTNPNRKFQENFVVEVDGKPVEAGQHFVGVGINRETLKLFLERCKRCADCPTRTCDINTRTFQDPEPQTQG